MLGGGVDYGAPEYGGNTVVSSTLVRLRYAARLYRATGKPVLVSGGDPRETGIANLRPGLDLSVPLGLRYVLDGYSAVTGAG